MVKKIKQNKGFTLIEILAVMIVLAIILGIGIPIMQKQIEKSKKQAFFNSVSNIVNRIKTDQIIKETDFCMYDYTEDKDNHTKNISSLYVLAHKKNEKIVYSVYASQDGKTRGIDIYDFSKLKSSEITNWVKDLTSEESYTKYATSLITIYGNTETEVLDYSICDLK